MNWLIAFLLFFFVFLLYWWYVFFRLLFCSYEHQHHLCHLLLICFFSSFACLCVCMCRFFFQYIPILSAKYHSLSEEKRSIKSTLIGFLCHVSSHPYHWCRFIFKRFLFGRDLIFEIIDCECVSRCCCLALGERVTLWILFLFRIFFVAVCIRLYFCCCCYSSIVVVLFLKLLSILSSVRLWRWVCLCVCIYVVAFCYFALSLLYYFYFILFYLWCAVHTRTPAVKYILK